VLSVPAESLTPAIAKDIGSEDRPKWVTADRWKRVRAIYTSFENAPIWLEEGGVKDRAAALLEALRTAPDHGLDTAAYPVSEIAALVNEKRLTDPASVSQAWHIPSVPSELDSAIVHGLENEDMKASLAAMAPQDPDYAALKDAYARYRDIAAKGDWPMTTTAGAALQSRLAMELTADSTRSETRGADSVNTAPAAEEASHSAVVAPCPVPGAPRIRPDRQARQVHDCGPQHHRRGPRKADRRQPRAPPLAATHARLTLRVRERPGVPPRCVRQWAEDAVDEGRRR
jgi:hypothetical protein